MENACSFRHDENKRGKVTQSSSPAPKPQTQNDWKSSLKENLSEAAAPLVRDPENRAKTTSIETVRTRLVIFGILWIVNITKHNRGANFVGKCVFMHREVDSQPNKTSKKSGGKISDVLLKKSKKKDAYSRIQCRRNPSRFYGRARNPGDRGEA